MEFDPVISSQDLETNLADDHIVVVDVRFSLGDSEWGRNNYIEGHIPGAFYAHLDDDLSAEIIPGQTGRHPWPSVHYIEELLSKFGVHSDSQIVIYDQGHGGIAARLWAMCQHVGLQNTSVLDGGWKRWTEEKRSVSTDIPQKMLSGFKALASTFEIVNVDSLAEAVCLVDARANKRYRGEEEPIDPIAGHIPGAINYPFLENLNEDLSWKSKAELVERFKPIAEKETTMYCGSGVTACHNMIAMKRAGLKLPNLYPGSWSHYITDENRAIEVC